MSSLPCFDPSSIATTSSEAPRCFDRRRFLATGSLAAVAAFLGTACGNGLSDGATGPGSVNTTVTLDDYPALGTVGGIVRISGVSTPVAVVRSDSSSYRAFSMVCPHAGTTIGIVGTGFRCPRHLAAFDASGQNTGGQRTSSLHEFTVTANSTAATLTIVG